jgi:hypothetical protein
MRHIALSRYVRSAEGKGDRQQSKGKEYAGKHRGNYNATLVR